MKLKINIPYQKVVGIPGMSLISVMASLTIKKYIEGPYEDLYCFPTIKSNDNCIVKNYLMVINEYPYRNTHIGINDFTEYQLTQENKIERVFNPHDVKKDNF